MRASSFGAALVTQVGALLYLAVYVVAFQHFYSVWSGAPERSWVHQLRVWWLTRESQAELRRRFRIWDLAVTSQEPAMPEAPGGP